MTISFIGTGKMATALARGIAAADSSIRFAAYDISGESISSFKQKLKDITVFDSIQSVLEASDIAFISAKPQNFPDIREHLSSYKNILVSIMAGISISAIQEYAPDARVIRVMPNTPCLVQEMAAGFSTGINVSDSDADQIRALLETSGIAVKVSEDKLDAVTALSGSGPAFTARIIEYFIQGAEKLGLERSVARRLFLKTVRGTVELLDQQDTEINELITMVTSKGGTTAAGRDVLENSDLNDVIFNTLSAAKTRSEELGK